MNIFWAYACLNPDYTFSKSARDMGVVFKELKREGIGKLLLYCTKRDNLGIAIHYSMPSVCGSYIRGDEPRFVSNRQGWINLLEDLGYQYDFVAGEQIEEGKLIKDQYKLLILPYSIALSPKEAAEIQQFVANGGSVIGDFQTAIMDHHCKLYDKGSLDDIFGIRRVLTDTRSFYVDSEFTQNKDFPYFDLFVYGSEGLQLVERGTRASTGKAAYVQDFSRAVAAVVVNEVDKGKGIYLNFGLEKYPELRKEEGGGQTIRELMKKILALTGVEKFAALKSSDGSLVEKGYETIYYSENSAEYVAILKDLAGGLKVGYDGLEISDGKAAGRIMDTIKVEFRKKAHVYDVRKKEYKGFVDTVEEQIASGDTSILSLLPYKVDGIKIEMKDIVGRGEDLTIGVNIHTDKPDNEYSNVLSFNLYNPAGEHEWIYSENITVAGRNVSQTYKVPYNEKMGTWKVTVKDVATGVTTEKLFEVK
jgi:hypothetical protein